MLTLEALPYTCSTLGLSSFHRIIPTSCQARADQFSHTWLLHAPPSDPVRAVLQDASMLAVGRDSEIGCYN